MPWHRVVGAGGEIKVPGDYAMEQRFRLESEGVLFRGRRVDMKRFEYRFRDVRPKSKKPARKKAKKIS